MLFGSGKVAELKARFESRKVELVLVDGTVIARAATQSGEGMGRQTAGPHRA
jgi:50S ribosomal subunit-associated GTPase HflX